MKRPHAEVLCAREKQYVLRGEMSMATRYDYKCGSCDTVYEVNVPSMINANPGETVPCPTCLRPMSRYYGAMTAQDMTINYGYREHRYDNETDRGIAQFQFTNL
jgi:hypothetical protein